MMLDVVPSRYESFSSFCPIYLRQVVERCGKMAWDFFVRPKSIR
jgi:hypothetical protein